MKKQQLLLIEHTHTHTHTHVEDDQLLYAFLSKWMCPYAKVSMPFTIVRIERALADKDHFQIVHRRSDLPELGLCRRLLTKWSHEMLVS